MCLCRLLGSGVLIYVLSPKKGQSRTALGHGPNKGITAKSPVHAGPDVVQGSGKIKPQEGSRERPIPPRASSEQDSGPRSDSEQSGDDIIETIMTTLFIQNSDHYNLDSFKDFNFSKGYDVYRDAINSNQAFLDGRWLDAKNASLLFSEGKLQGVQVIHVARDIAGYLDATRELFGTVASNQMEEYEIPAGKYIESDAVNYTIIRYCFKNTIAFVVIGPNVEPFSSITVQVFNKDYLVKLLKSYFMQKKKLFDDLKKVVDHCGAGEFDWSSIPFPKYDGMRTVMLENPRYEIGTTRHSYLAGNQSLGAPVIFADEALAVQEIDIRGSKRLEVRMSMNRFPWFQVNGLLTPVKDAGTQSISCPGLGTLQEDSDRGNSILAQLYFPPLSPTIEVTQRVRYSSPPDHPLKMFHSYKWKTKNGWDVTVTESNTIVLVRRPKAEL